MLVFKEILFDEINFITKQKKMINLGQNYKTMPQESKKLNND
jgi:hypothetical protein